MTKTVYSGINTEEFKEYSEAKDTRRPFLRQVGNTYRYLNDSPEKRNTN